MSDLKVPDFKASELIAAIYEAFSAMPDAEKAAQMKKTNGIFELQVTNEKKETATWTIDMKKQGLSTKALQSPSRRHHILSDDTLTDLASGKVWCALWAHALD
ncbi:hypothetical protein B0H13DRAFT_2247495 [Mycena leptocephala]|nr:hypothetical protein B0H13DRAFT_2247495 [Mycena leptocephala]